MKFSLPWATPYDSFPALGPAWLISSFQMSDSCLIISLANGKNSSVMMKKTRRNKCECRAWAEKVRQMRVHVSIMTPTRLLVLQKHEQKHWDLLLSVTKKWRQEGGHNPCRQMSGGCPEHVFPGHRSCPQAPLRLLGWLLQRLGALWGHRVQESRSCCSSVFSLKIPTGGFLISLWRCQLCPPNPVKAAGGTPSSSPAAERGWGGPALPCPGLLGTEWRRHRRPELPQAGGDLAALYPYGCSLVLRVPASLGGAWVCGPSGSGTLGSWVSSGALSQPEGRGSVDSSVYVYNSNLRITRKQVSAVCTWDGGADAKEPACHYKRHRDLGSTSG